jgi:hypothetical protein
MAECCSLWAWGFLHASLAKGILEKDLAMSKKVQVRLPRPSLVFSCPTTSSLPVHAEADGRLSAQALHQGALPRLTSRLIISNYLMFHFAQALEKYDAMRSVLEVSRRVLMQLESQWGTQLDAATLFPCFVE